VSRQPNLHTVYTLAGDNDDGKLAFKLELDTTEHQFDLYIENSHGIGQKNGANQKASPYYYVFFILRQQ